MSFNLFLNKVKPKTPNVKILRLSFKTSISRCFSCCQQNVCGIPRVKNWFQKVYDARAKKYDEIKL